MLLKPTNEDVEQAKKEIFKKAQTPWDPTMSFDFETVKDNSAEIEAKFENLEKNPNQISKHYGFAWGFFAILFSIGLTITILTGIIHFVIFGFILGILPVGIVNQMYKKLGVDLVKLQIAKEKNWIYDPHKNSPKWRQLKDNFPEIFKKGNKNRYVEDQYWGDVKNTQFHMGLFSYTVETGSGKNKSSTTYHKNYFAMKLEKPLKSRFFLYPENTFSKIGNFFTKKEINTESIEFNKQFAFSYNGSKGEKAQEIVKTLSPAVQQELLDMNKKKGDFEVLFVNNCIVFLFDGKLLPKPKTNFRKSLKVAKEDKQIIEKQINELITIGSKIYSYLD